MNTALGKKIEELIPKRLDEIITIKRDRFSLSWANENGFAEFPSVVTLMDGQKPVKATLNEWRIVCFTNPRRTSYFLTGFKSSTDNPLATSEIKAVDFKQKIVLTNNSLYRLGTKGEGEADIHILLCICHCFHSWGMGNALGILPVFY